MTKWHRSMWEPKHICHHWIKIWFWHWSFIHGTSSPIILHLSLMFHCFSISRGTTQATLSVIISLIRSPSSPPLSGNHYKSDYHRYNMKRRVAGLPPVALAIFNKKVLDHKEEIAIVSSTRSEFCEVCKWVIEDRVNDIQLLIIPQ